LSLTQPSDPLWRGRRKAPDRDIPQMKIVRGGRTWTCSREKERKGDTGEETRGEEATPQYI